MIRTIKDTAGRWAGEGEAGRSGRTGRSARKPKCRRGVLLHRAGYKSPAYKRALRETARSRSPPLAVRVHRFALALALARFTTERTNEPAACFFFSLSRSTKSTLETSRSS